MDCPARRLPPGPRRAARRVGSGCTGSGAEGCAWRLLYVGLRHHGCGRFAAGVEDDRATVRATFWVAMTTFHPPKSPSSMPMPTYVKSGLSTFAR